MLGIGCAAWRGSVPHHTRWARKSPMLRNTATDSTYTRTHRGSSVSFPPSTRNCRSYAHARTFVAMSPLVLTHTKSISPSLSNPGTWHAATFVLPVIIKQFVFFLLNSCYTRRGDKHKIVCRYAVHPQYTRQRNSHCVNCLTSFCQTYIFFTFCHSIARANVLLRPNLRNTNQSKRCDTTLVKVTRETKDQQVKDHGFSSRSGSVLDL